MLSSKRLLARFCILIFSCILITVNSFAADTSSADETPTLGELYVVYTVSFTAGDECTVKIWTSGVAFPVGDSSDSAYYFVSAETLTNYSALLHRMHDPLEAYLLENGLTDDLSSDEALENALTLTEMEIVLYYQENTYTLSTESAADGWCLLKVSENLNIPDIVPVRYTSKSPAGSVYYWNVIGNSCGIDDTFTETRILDRQKITVQQISGNQILLNGTLPDTALGSPILNESGELTGVVVYAQDNDEINCVSAYALQEMLFNAGLSSESPGTASNSVLLSQALANTAKYQSIVIWVTVGAGILLILIIILLVKRTLQAQAAERDAQQQPQESAVNVSLKNRDSELIASPQKNPVTHEPPLVHDIPVQPSSTPVISISPSENHVHPIIAPEAPVQNEPGIEVIVVDGKTPTTVFKVTANTVLGRDPAQCQFCFSPDATAISRRHCRLFYLADRNQLVLEDLNSSNGTYTPDGRRYEPGKKYLLHSGDRFYLGAPANMLQVR